MKTAGIVLLLATTCLAAPERPYVTGYYSDRDDDYGRSNSYQYMYFLLQIILAPPHPSTIAHYSHTKRHHSIPQIVIIQIFQPCSSLEVREIRHSIMGDWVQWSSTVPGPTYPALTTTTGLQRRSPDTPRRASCSVEDGALTSPVTLSTLTPPSGPRHTASVRIEWVTPAGGGRTARFWWLEEKG